MWCALPACLLSLAHRLACVKPYVLSCSDRFDSHCARLPTVVGRFAAITEIQLLSASALYYASCPVRLTIVPCCVETVKREASCCSLSSRRRFVPRRTQWQQFASASFKLQTSYHFRLVSVKRNLFRRNSERFEPLCSQFTGTFRRFRLLRAKLL